MMHLPPLQAAGIAQIDAQETRAEKFWMRIPILGWAIADSLWRERAWPIVEQVEKQLTSRPQPEPAIWGNDPRRAQIGLFLSRIAKEEMGWPNDHFVPADPVEVVFWAHEDGLDFKMVLIRIEEELDVKIRDAEVIGWSGKTLADVVDDLLAKQEQAR
jgi:hypothetical protein